MTTAFVISEFNPFHHGHKYLIDALHRDFDNVVCIMSGNSVQRGESACAEKYIRAKIAVLNGANLVFELPFPFCSLAASEFAKAGVFLANALGCNNLAFGVEAEGQDVAKAAEILYDRNAISNYIKLHPKLSYPKAALEMIKEEFKERADIIEKPNNILGAEYINAIRTWDFDIKPVFIKREKEFASSSEIRKVLYENFDSGLEMLPEETKSILKDVPLWDYTRLDAAILAAIRLTKGAGDFYGIDTGGLRKIYSAALVSSSVKELCEKSVSANLTYARIRRTLLYVLLNVGKEYRYRGKGTKTPSYALVLAADRTGREYLSKEKKNFTVPVITKPADFIKENENVIYDFEFSLSADRVLSIASGKSGEYNPLKMTPFMK
ncbi:MAG: nucleotidyltransferase family protein [Clostridiales bacterium]|jgi:predicted nucleotidyltransferase|nr:nucleotidyltransferase family protein [Clostridiales bacterium]